MPKKYKTSPYMIAKKGIKEDLSKQGKRLSPEDIEALKKISKKCPKCSEGELTSKFYNDM